MRRTPFLAAACAALSLAVPTTARAELARPADSFVHSIGVNTHLTFAGTPYTDFARVRERLEQLGVNQIRDGVCGDCPWQLAELRTLGRDGIRLDAMPGKPTDSAATFESNIAAVKALGATVDTVEGANEWDLFAPKRAAWAAQERSYQQRLWNATRADPALARLPVLGPSLVYSWTAPSSWRTLGSLSSYLTYGNSHGYAGGKTPESMVRPELGHARAVSGSKPIVMSEAGWHNALQQVNNDHPPTPEDVAAVYVPRLFLANFQAGIARTYIYELYDEKASGAATHQEDSFGLLRADDTPKPAFTALKNLVALLADHGSAIAPADVPVSVTSRAGDLRHLVLRKRDGRVDVVLWRPGSLWNPQTRTRRTVAATTATVAFGGTVNGVKAYRPVTSASGTALSPSAGRVTVSVGAAPVVLEKR